LWLLTLSREEVGEEEELVEKEAEMQPTGFVSCPVPGCNEVMKAKGRYGHFKTRHPELSYPDYKDKFKPAKAPEPSEVKPGEGPLYKGETDTTAILRDILKKYPDIPSKVVDEVCSWAEYGPIHPTQLVSLLQSFRGITATTAYILAQKYALALQKAQQEGKVTPIVIGGSFPQGGQPFGFFPTGFPAGPTGIGPIGGVSPGPQGVTLQGTTQYGAGPYGAAPQYGMFPPWQQPQDVRTIVREELHAAEERKPKEKETEAYVEIEEPVRLPDGRVVVGDDDRPIMKRMRVPASQAAQLISPKEDVEMKLLEKLKTYKELFGKEELTTEKIREIIKEERPPAPSETEKPITLEDVKKASTDAAQSAVETVMASHEKENTEEKRHKEVIAAIERSGSAKAVEGYREDSYRILGQGLGETASVLKERKPIEVIIREGGPLILGERPPKEVEAGAGEGLLERLKKRGWVVEQ